MTAPPKIQMEKLTDIVGDMMCKSIVEAGQYYNLNIPMAGSYKVGATWAETH